MSEEALTIDKFNHMLLIRARRHADEDLGRSTPVRITGPINRPELNGRVAKMIGPKPGDPLRMVVSLWPDNTELGLKFVNIELILAEGDTDLCGLPLDQLWADLQAQQ
jgi:hypothetical protein